MQKILKKKELNNFLQDLMKSYQIVAPIKKDNTKFEVIKDYQLIYLKQITQIPPKKFFLPDNEILLEFKNNKITELRDTTPKTIIFGLRKCDLNSIFILDKIMKDPLYIQKRKKTILIGIHCDNPDEYCFCNSMELEDNCYDLFFYPEKNNYYISIGSKKGEGLVNHLPNAKKEIKKQIKNSKKLINKEIDKHYQNKIWETDSEKCLSCGACTVYCPSCNCFDIRDSLNINLIDGKRTRTETSCQLQSFSRVAGGKIFRESRLSRFKHFVYHKIVYFKKTYDKYMCVGCGRCLRVCPTKIDWVNTINTLYEVDVMRRRDEKIK